MVLAWMHRVTMRVGVLALAAGLAACGGGGGSGAPAAPTIGAAGGTVSGPGGARVEFPAHALAGEVSVKIAQDANGAPALPDDVVRAAGSVYAITPHGGDFALPATVRIPVERVPADASEQLLLLTAEPGDTQWRVLSGAAFEAGRMVAQTQHFSYFVPVLTLQRQFPALTLRVEGRNNQGSGGAGVINPETELSDFSLGNRDLLSGGHYAQAKMRVDARLTFPPQLATRAGAAPPALCEPTGLGHEALQWDFQANGSAVVPLVDHRRRAYADAPAASGETYPASEAEDTFYSSYYHYLGVGNGFGAMHYYGRSAAALRGARAGGSDDAWVLPPAGNLSHDDLLTWGGSVALQPTLNGRVRIGARIATTCGLVLEATVAFRLNQNLEPPQRGDYAGVLPTIAIGAENPLITTPGNDVGMSFDDTAPGRTSSIAWEHSTDGVSWSRPAALAARVSRTDGDFGVAHYRLALPAVAAADAGFYRAFACGTGLTGSRCVAGAPIQLQILATPPRITVQPASLTAMSGETASFTVGVDLGAPSRLATLVAYQTTVNWQSRRLVAGVFTPWQTVAGDLLKTTFTTPVLTAQDNLTQVRAVVSNGAGSAASDAAWLWVLQTPQAPQITSEPADLGVYPGSTAVFVAAAQGGNLSYQWRFDGTPIVGANGATLTLNAVGVQHAGRYELVVSNALGSATTRAALLDVRTIAVALPPVITAPPVAMSVAEGSSAAFGVSVSGSGPYTYAWFKQGEAAPVADTPMLLFAAARPDQAGSYSVRVSNATGAVTSAAATLTVTPGSGPAAPPVIVTPPSAVAAYPGGAVTFAVAASGSGPLQYQWKRNGVDLPGATSPVLGIAAVGGLDAGQYSVEVRNGAGVAASTPVALIVIGAPLITAPPVAVSVVEGAGASFSVAASGDALRYQWTRNHVAIPGATQPGYTTPALGMADSGAVYGVVVYNGAGVVISPAALLTVTPYTEWTASRVLSAQADHGDAADLALAAIDAGSDNGTSAGAWAAWFQNTGSGGVLRVSRDGGDGVWSAPVEVQGGFDAYRPRIAAAGSQAALVFGHLDAQGGYHLAATTYAGGVWSAPQRIDTGHPGNTIESALLMAGGSRALALWIQHDGARYALFASQWSGSGWSAPQRVDSGAGADANTLRTSVNSLGHALVSWRQGTVAWSASVTLAAEAYTIDAPRQASAPGQHVWSSRGTIDRDGIETLAWVQSGPVAGRSELWVARRLPGQAWGAAVPVADEVYSNADLENLQITSDDSGAVMLAWVSSTASSNGDVVWSARLSPGSPGWSAPAQRSAPGLRASSVRLAGNALGRHVLSWFAHDGEGRSLGPAASAWDPQAGQWSAAMPMDPVTPGSTETPQLVVTPSGGAVAAWLRRLDAENEVVSARLPPQSQRP